MSDHFCRRRWERGETQKEGENPDKWILFNGEKSRSCNYCGSMHPGDLFEAIEQGVEIIPTDKNYKIYVGESGGRKFYFQHFDEEQGKKFIELYNARKIKIGYPGYFYVTPFFCTVNK